MRQNSKKAQTSRIKLKEASRINILFNICIQFYFRANTYQSWKRKIYSQKFYSQKSMTIKYTATAKKIYNIYSTLKENKVIVFTDQTDSVLLLMFGSLMWIEHVWFRILSLQLHIQPFLIVTYDALWTMAILIRVTVFTRMVSFSFPKVLLQLLKAVIWWLLLLLICSAKCNKRMGPFDSIRRDKLFF